MSTHELHHAETGLYYLPRQRSGCRSVLFVCPHSHSWTVWRTCKIKGDRPLHVADHNETGTGQVQKKWSQSVTRKSKNQSQNWHLHFMFYNCHRWSYGQTYTNLALHWGCFIFFGLSLHGHADLNLASKLIQARTEPGWIWNNLFFVWHGSLSLLRVKALKSPRLRMIPTVLYR